MNKTIFETIEESCRVLQLPFSSKEFAELAEENAMSEDAAKTRLTCPRFMYHGEF